MWSARHDAIMAAGEIYLPVKGTGEDEVVVCGELVQAGLEFALVD
jgi:hypothetical protein